jgi:enoyl-CoA hydratase/carnithine racemase
LLSSRVLSANETDGWGLFNGLVEREELLPKVHAYAQNLAARVAPSAQRMTKRQIYLDQHRDVGSAVSDSEDLLETAMTDPDYREGVKALLEKRTPRWGEND